MKRYNEEDKAWLVQEWTASGKSKWAFTRELGLPYQILANGHANVCRVLKNDVNKTAVDSGNR